MKKKTLYTVLLLCTVSITANAQITILKQKTIGGKGSDWLRQSRLTSDGGQILGGSSSSIKGGEKTEDSRGGFDFWIVKLDARGKIQWDKTFGGSKDDQLLAIEQTKDNGYILGGHSLSDASGEKKEHCRGLQDYWLIKLDSSGKIQWDKTIGGDNIDLLNDLVQTLDGGFILGGYSLSGKSGEKSQESKGSGDYWIVKLDAEGNIQWDKSYGGDGKDELFSIIQTKDRGYLLGGSSYSGISGDKTDTSRGMQDYWIIKLDKLGNKTWDRTLGGKAADDCKSVVQLPSSGYIIGGSSSSGISGDKSQQKRGGFDFWIAKLADNGVPEWNKTIGGANDDLLKSVSIIKDNGYILAGSSASGVSGEKSEASRGSSDYWIVKQNSFGNTEWDKTIGGSSEDIAVSIHEVVKNHYVIGGYSYSGISGDKTDITRGGYDYWVVAIDGNNNITVTQNETGALQSKEAHSNNFIIYPNPVSDVLIIRTDGNTSFSLFNASGSAVRTQLIKGSGEINVSSLPAGAYLLRNNGTGKVQKIMITK